MKQISPDVVMVDGLNGGVFGMSLARELGVPLVYRAHNVECEYTLQLAVAERNPLKKLKFLANAPRTAWLEKRLRDTSSLIYEISRDDLQVWRKHPSEAKAKLLPPYLHPSYNGKSAGGYDHRGDIDVLYIGNLYTPNNVFGLRWFAEKVVPLLGDLRLVAAGSNPSPEVSSALNRADVAVIANPEAVQPLYDRARVLINPIWHGSGVNIKMIEALATGKPVVSTSQGARGLSERLRAHVSLGDTPESFAGAILRRHDGDFSAAQRNDVLEEHGWESVVTLLGDLRSVIDRNTDSAPPKG